MGRHRKATNTGRKVARVALTATMATGGLLSSQIPANAASGNTWNQLAACESSGDWQINTGNGYYGGLQFSASTWREFGGTQFAEQAHLATREQQITIAERVLAVQGWHAWPVCSQRINRAEPARPDVPIPNANRIPNAAQPNQSDSNRYVIVVAGDTLSGIGQVHHQPWQHLASVNHIVDPNLIFPNQVIHLG